MKISIIIVSWNTRDLLKKCLESIFKFTQDIDFDVFVIDNLSGDGTIDMINKNFPQVKLIANNFNAGFAKANNQPFLNEVGDEVLFMNPDMEFKENTVEAMHQLLAANADINIATCQLAYPDGELQHSIKRLPTFWSQFLILLKLHHFLSFLPTIKNYLYKDFDYTKEQLVENIMGAFVYARTNKFKELGSWNERYWLWWEDVDLCKTAKERGIKILYTPKTKVIHYEGRSFAQVATVAKQKRFIRGMLTYFKLHHSIFSFLILAIFSPISIALAWFTNVLDIKPRPQSKV
jgi:GT2 family glycosyltransferase